MLYRPGWRDLWRFLTWSPEPAFDVPLRLALRDLDAALLLLAGLTPRVKEARTHIRRAIETLEAKSACAK